MSSISVDRQRRKCLRAAEMPDHSSIFLPYAVFVEVIAGSLLVAGLACLALDLSTGSAVRATLIAALAVGYREATVRSELLRQFLHLYKSDPRSDQSSIWTFAAALTLPLGWATLVLVAVTVQTLIRGRRHHVVRPARFIFSRAGAMLGIAAAWGIGLATPDPHGAAAAALIATQLLAYTTTSLAAAVIYAYLEQPLQSRRQLRTLLPDLPSLGLELQSLLVGVLLASLVTFNLWLAPLAPIVALLLQRSSNAGAVVAQARTDAKTGALTSQAWREAVDQTRSSTPAGTLLLLDLDHFKTVNDTHGHLIGDQLLRAVSAAVQRELRTADLFGRFGGEEFVIWVTDVGTEQARALAERLRTAVAATAVTLSGEPASTVNATVSIGVTTGCDELNVLLATADTALYTAKHLGRNRVSMDSMARNPGAGNYSRAGLAGGSRETPAIGTESRPSRPGTP